MNYKSYFDFFTKGSLLAASLFVGTSVSGEWINLSSEKKATESEELSVTTTVNGSLVNIAQKVDNIRQYKLTLDVPGIDVSNVEMDGKKFQHIEIPGVTGYTYEVGKPAVPMHIITLEVPYGSEAKVAARPVTDKYIDRKIYVEPAQIPYPDVDGFQPKITVDDLTYSGSEYYPADYILKSETYVVRDRQFVRVEVALARTRPGTGELQVATSIDVIVNIANTSVNALDQKPVTSRSLNELFTESYDAGVDAVAAPERYMIIMDDQFNGNSALNTFINWKRRKGYKVVVVKTSQINSNGAPDSAQIRNYMLNLSAANYPAYLLIIGDETANNGVDGWYVETYTSNYGGYSDLYYAERDPLVAGQTPVPDLFYGRLPAKTSTELTTMLSKVTTMDRTPPTTNIYRKTLVAAQIQDHEPSSVGPNNIADRYFCETADAFASYFEGNSYTNTRSFVNPDNVTSSCKWRSSSLLWNSTSTIGTRVFNTFLNGTTATSRISNTINGGISFVIHRDHGSATGWGSPSFSTTNVNALSNGTKRPVIYSLNCLTGSYHKNNNFTRALLLHSNGGAYAVISAVDVSFSGPNDWMAHGCGMGLLPSYRTWINSSTSPNFDKNLPAPTSTNMHGMTEGNARKLGQNLNYGKIYMMQRTSSARTETFQIFHVFGDPEGDIHVRTPVTRTVTHPSQIGTGSQTVRITSSGSGKRQVCLYSSTNNIHLVDVTTSSTSTFTINPTATGIIYVTVTGYDRRPYEGVIYVSQNVYQTLGFEYTSKWTITSGSGTLARNTTNKTQGSASITFGGNNYREITSAAMSTSQIVNETSKLAVDLYIGSTQPNPSWIGQVQVFANSANAGLNRVSLGAVNLTGKPFNTFSTLQFTVPSTVLSKLRGSYSDFKFIIALNTNANSGPYYIDNLRFVP